MSTVSFIFRIKLSCPDCNNAIPVNRITDEVECPNCFTKVNLNQEWWEKKIFTKDNLMEASQCAEGEARTTSIISADMKYDLAYGKRFPRCQKCKDDLSEDEQWNLNDILQSAESSAFIHCKKCNEPMSIRKPDEFVKSLVNFPVHAILAEDQQSSRDTAYTGKPMMFACLNCGAGLKADGSDRVVACEYCNTDNFLPEELWRRLHPVPKPKVLFLLAEY